MAATQISRYESGRAVPRALAMRKLADALETSFEWLSKGEQPATAPGTTLGIGASFIGGAASGTAGIAMEIPSTLYDALKASAKAAGRSLDAEIVDRLERSVANDWAAANSPLSFTTNRLRVDKPVSFRVKKGDDEQLVTMAELVDQVYAMIERKKSKN